jgi:hypothetical protein
MISLVILYAFDFILFLLLVYFFFVLYKKKKFNLKIILIIVLLLPFVALMHVNLYNYGVFEHHFDAIFRNAISIYYAKHSRFPKSLEEIEEIEDYKKSMNDHFIYVKPQIGLQLQVKGDTLFYLVYSYGNDFDDDKAEKSFDKNNACFLFPFKDGDIIIKKGAWIAN